MSETIKMDRFGRIVIPRRVRERYGLVEGSHQLEVVEDAEGILLRPSAEEIPARRHPSGWVVFGSGDEEETVDSTEAIQEERERRHRTIRADE
jgi:AbrB family looped-hinge helix DNA binding protein